MSHPALRVLSFGPNYPLWLPHCLSLISTMLCITVIMRNKMMGTEEVCMWCQEVEPWHTVDYRYSCLLTGLTHSLTSPLNPSLTQQLPFLSPSLPPLSSFLSLRSHFFSLSARVLWQCSLLSVFLMILDIHCVIIFVLVIGWWDILLIDWSIVQALSRYCNYSHPLAAIIATHCRYLMC